MELITLLQINNERFKIVIATKFTAQIAVKFNYKVHVVDTFIVSIANVEKSFSFIARFISSILAGTTLLALN